MPRILGPKTKVLNIWLHHHICMVKKSVIRPSMLNLRIVHNLFVNKDGITIKDIATNLKTDYKNTHNAVERLFKWGVIKKEKIGNYNICKINYGNEDIVEYLKEYNFYVKVKVFKSKYPTEYNILKETISKSSENIKSLSPLFMCIIFGSYAKGEEKKESDIDVLVVPQVTAIGSLDFKRILSEKNAPYHKKFHIEVQNIYDFIKDLKEKNKVSIATEIYKQPPIVLHGDDIFFKIMVEASKSW